MRLPLKYIAVPFAESRPGFVRGMAKLEECSAGRLRFPHLVVHQNEFAKLSVEKGSLRPDLGLPESFRLSNRVGVKGGALDAAAAGPKTDTAYFMGIGFSRHGVGARSFRGPAT